MFDGLICATPTAGAARNRAAIAGERCDALSVLLGLHLELHAMRFDLVRGLHQVAPLRGRPRSKAVRSLDSASALAFVSPSSRQATFAKTSPS